MQLGNSPIQKAMKVTNFGYEIELLGDDREVTWDRSSRTLSVGGLTETEARKVVLFLQAADRLTQAAERPRQADPIPGHPAPDAPTNVVLPKVKPAPYTPPPGPHDDADPPRSELERAVLDSGGTVIRVENVESVNPPAAGKSNAKGRKPRKSRAKKVTDKPDTTPPAVDPATAAALADQAKKLADGLEAKISGAVDPTLPEISDEGKSELTTQIQDLTQKTEALKANAAAKTEAGKADPMARFKNTGKTGRVSTKKKAPTNGQPPAEPEFDIKAGDSYRDQNVVQAGVEDIGGDTMWVIVLGDGSQAMLDINGEEQEYIPAEPDDPSNEVVPPATPDADEKPVGVDPGSVNFGPEATPEPEGVTGPGPEPTGETPGETVANDTPDAWVLVREGLDSLPLPAEVKESQKLVTVIKWLMANDPIHKTGENGVDDDRMVAQVAGMQPHLKSLSRTKAGSIARRVGNSLTILGVRG